MSSPIIIFYGNNLAEQIIEKRTNIHMYFVNKTDKNLNVVSNESKENCMSDELIRTTEIDNKLTKRTPYLFALIFFLLGHSSIKTYLLSLKLKLKDKVDIDEKHNKD